MSIRGGVAASIVAGVVLAGCAALVGAEEATLVQGAAGSGQGGGAGTAGSGLGGGAGTAGEAGSGEGGGAGASGCLAGETLCNEVCVNLKKDPDNCGTCGNKCNGAPCNEGQCGGSDLPEVRDVCLGGIPVADIAPTEAFVYVLCQDGQILRSAAGGMQFDSVSQYKAKALRLARTGPGRVIGILDLGASSQIHAWDDASGESSSELGAVSVNLDSRLATADFGSVFVSADYSITLVHLSGPFEATCTATVKVATMVADDTFIYAIGANAGAFAYGRSDGCMPIKLETGKNPVSVALRPGGALVVREGLVGTASGDITFANPYAAQVETQVLIDNLNKPIEAVSVNNDDILYIEDPSNLGRIAKWSPNGSRVVLAEGQKGARALRWQGDHVYWGTQNGKVCRIHR